MTTTTSTVTTAPTTSPFLQNTGILEDARILVVDDAPEICALFATILKKQGAVVTCVDNGQATLDLHQQCHQTGKPLMLIILDWNMPDMGGLEIARCIRARDERVKIAFLTAYHDLIRPELMAEVNAELWAKPIEIRTLLHNVSDVLHQA